MSEDPRREEPDEPTEQIPTVSGTVVEYGEDEYGPILGPGQGPSYGVNLIAQREPSEYVKRYLYPTEKFRGEWRRHWIHLVKRLSIGVAATFVLGYAAGWMARHNVRNGLTILVLIWLAVMAWVLFDVVQWYYDRFVLTNKRVMLVEGVVARTVAMMPLGRVTDMKLEQSPLGRFLNYATFVFESAGQQQALRTVANLPSPNELYIHFVEEMYDADASEGRRRPSKVDDGI
jgi:membrane protein YdbS with pleckstrin-like domain